MCVFLTTTTYQLCYQMVSTLYDSDAYSYTDIDSDILTFRVNSYHCNVTHRFFQKKILIFKEFATQPLVEWIERRYSYGFCSLQSVTRSLCPISTRQLHIAVVQSPPRFKSVLQILNKIARSVSGFFVRLRNFRQF